MNGAILGQALAYAVRDWPVFPCRPGGKEPAIPAAHPKGDPLRDTCRGECGRDGHGCHDATTDPSRIRAWWASWPTANVAIATGSPAPDVLDVDVKPDGDGFAAFNRLQRAGLLGGASALVRTRSGGLHVYYTGTHQGCGSLPRHHLDFRSSGGYVVAPPSFVEADSKGPAGAYELLEERQGTGRLDWPAVKRLLDPPPRRRRAAPKPGTWRGGGLPPAVQRALAVADPPDRSAAFHRLVGACVRSGMDEAAIHELAASYPPAVEKYGARLAGEVKRSMESIGV